MCEYEPAGALLFYTETDLIGYASRHYSPALGRWLSRDSIEERGGFNLCGFINNEPVNK